MMNPHLVRLLLLLTLGAAACNRSPNLIVIERLAPGGGGADTSAGAQFDIVFRMQGDATGFNARDLLRLHLDGADRTEDLLFGGYYGILRIDPPPAGLHTVELFARQGPLVDSFTWTVVPYAGPTLTGVAPDTARTGTQVTITGTGFNAGLLRVFFGGIEGSVDASSATSITATVPDAALPGIVWVLVGAEAADGVVGFQPLDSSDAPVPLPTTVHLFGALPGHVAVEQPVRLFGVGFDDTAIPFFQDRSSERLVWVETITLDPVGEILVAFAVPFPATPTGTGTLRLVQFGQNSNSLPFLID